MKQLHCLESIESFELNIFLSQHCPVKQPTTLQSVYFRASFFGSVLTESLEMTGVSPVSNGCIDR